MPYKKAPKDKPKKTKKKETRLILQREQAIILMDFFDKMGWKYK
jgi:hypothetical protein